MIKIIKGLLWGHRNMRSYNPDSCEQTLSFEFRGKCFDIKSLEKWDEPPYLGGILDRSSVLSLFRFLTECLDDIRCDECYKFKLPSNFDVKGEIRCIHCGELYK